MKYISLRTDDMLNGNGLRVVLFVSGCPHHCKGCHNQWTWNFNQGKVFEDNKDDIYKELDNWLSRDYVEGLTFSGGDPLCQDTV